MFAPACLCQDAILLDALVEALEGAFERFVIADDYFCQELLTPPSCVGRRATQGAAGCKFTIRMRVRL